MRLDRTYNHNFPLSLLSSFNHFGQITAKASVFKHELEKTRVSNRKYAKGKIYTQSASSLHGQDQDDIMPFRLALLAQLF